MFTLQTANQLFQSLKTDYDPDGRKELIELHLPLVIGMARKYARRIEREPDDYIGAGQLALVEAIDNSFRYMTHNEISKYVVVHVKHAIKKFYREDRVVAIPARTQDYLFKLGYLVNITVRALEPRDISIINRNDLLDSLIELLPELIQRQVLMLRLSYYNDLEISILLDKDIKEVRSIKNKIKKILINLLEE